MTHLSHVERNWWLHCSGMQKDFHIIKNIILLVWQLCPKLWPACEWTLCLLNSRAKLQAAKNLAQICFLREQSQVIILLFVWTQFIHAHADVPLKMTQELLFFLNQKIRRTTERGEKASCGWAEETWPILSKGKCSGGISYRAFVLPIESKARVLLVPKVMAGCTPPCCCSLLETSPDIPLWTSSREEQLVPTHRKCPLLDLPGGSAASKHLWVLPCPDLPPCASLLDGKE